MIFRYLAGGLAVLLVAGMLMSGCGQKVSEIQFVADVAEVRNDTTIIDRLFVKGDKYRLEQNSGQNRTFILVDRTEGLTTVLIEKDKQYGIMPSNATMSQMNDPYQGLWFAASRLIETKYGQEEVAGYTCDKYGYAQDSAVFLTKWVSVDLNWPIKIVSQRIAGHDKTLELRNIREMEVDEALFEIPANYTKFVDQPIQLPDWTDKLLTAKAVEMPLTQELDEGELLKVAVVPGKALWVRADSKSGAPFEGLAVPYKDGLPVGGVSSLKSFSLPGKIAVRVYATPTEADEIFIGAIKNDIIVEAKYYDMLEQKVAAGSELRLPLTNNISIQWRMVNQFDGKSKFHWDFYEGGQQMDDEVIGEAKFRRWFLEDPNEALDRPMKAYGDELVITVDEGEVLFKVAQVDHLTY